MSDLFVVIMAAGKGTRMNHPDLPKVMVELGGRPMVARVLDRALELEPVSTILIVGHRGELVREFVGLEYPSEAIEIVEQTEQLGTGHAVMQAAPLIEGRPGEVLVLSGDVPMISRETLHNLVEHHRSRGSVATMLTVELEDPTGYGRVLRDGEGGLRGVVEQKDASVDEREIREINAGIYVFDAEDLVRLLPRIGNDNASGEYYLPDVLWLALQEGLRCEAFLGENPVEVRGVNDPDQLAGLEEELAR